VVLISVPFGGSARALKMVLSGDDFDIPIIEALNMRRMQRTFDSPFALLPTKQSWGDDEILV
jgi:hypothetical protein